MKKRFNFPFFLSLFIPGIPTEIESSLIPCFSQGEERKEKNERSMSFIVNKRRATSNFRVIVSPVSEPAKKKKKGR